MARTRRVPPTNEPPRFYWEIWRDPGQGYIPYFWEELTSQAMIFFLFLGVMGGLALLWPAYLAPRANILVTPPGIKPEWYFLSLFQLIKVIPEIAGILLPGVIVFLMIILPFSWTAAPNAIRCVSRSRRRSASSSSSASSPSRSGAR